MSGSFYTCRWRSVCRVVVPISSASNKSLRLSQHFRRLLQGHPTGTVVSQGCRSILVPHNTTTPFQCQLLIMSLVLFPVLIKIVHFNISQSRFPIIDRSALLCFAATAEFCQDRGCLDQNVVGRRHDALLGGFMRLHFGEHGWFDVSGMVRS